MVYGMENPDMNRVGTKAGRATMVEFLITLKSGLLWPPE